MRGCCKSLYELLLVVLNVADLCSGVLLIAWALWLATGLHIDLGSPVVWAMPLACGGTLLVSAMLTLGGMSAPGARCASCALRAAALLAVPIGLVALVSASVMFGMRGKVLDYIIGTWMIGNELVKNR